MLNIVVPMAGRGSRFVAEGYKDPKPLISVGGRPMIEWVIENIRPKRAHRFIFICLAAHLDLYPEIASKLESLCPNCVIIRIESVTEGAACTVLLAKKLIDAKDPLMIANSDQIVDLNIDEYLSRGDSMGVDGVIMTFWSDHPKWSFCRMLDDGSIAEVVEKKVISNEATVGIYNFSRGSDFVRSAESMIKMNDRVNGEFYVAPCYNRLISDGARIVAVRTGREYAGMYGLGIPSDLEVFKTTDYFKTRENRSDVSEQDMSRDCGL